MESTLNREVIERFWGAMQENDWRAAARLLDDDFSLEYPQSGEHFRGRESFIAINEEYPAAGRWRFTVHRIIADHRGVASDVTVTDGAVSARSVSFFELRDGRIWRHVEYWPDRFEAPEWRTRLTWRFGAGEDTPARPATGDTR